MRKRPGEKNVSIWTTNSQINNLQSSDQDKQKKKQTGSDFYSNAKCM